MIKILSLIVIDRWKCNGGLCLYWLIWGGVLFLFLYFIKYYVRVKNSVVISNKWSIVGFFCNLNLLF